MLHCCVLLVSRGRSNFQASTACPPRPVVFFSTTEFGRPVLYSQRGAHHHGQRAKPHHRSPWPCELAYRTTRLERAFRPLPHSRSLQYKHIYMAKLRPSSLAARPGRLRLWPVIAASLFIASKRNQRASLKCCWPSVGLTAHNSSSTARLKSETSSLQRAGSRLANTRPRSAIARNARCSRCSALKPKARAVADAAVALNTSRRPPARPLRGIAHTVTHELRKVALSRAAVALAANRRRQR